MPASFHAFGAKSRLVLSLVTVGLGLAACGGGDGGSAASAASTDTAAESTGTTKPESTVTDTSVLSVSTEACPAGYSSIDFDNSSLSSKNYSFGYRDAAFTFVNVSSPVSFLICMGKPATPLTQAGYEVLSETYDLRVTASTAAKAAGIPLPSLQTKFAIKFKVAGLPTNLGSAELSSKIGLYTVDSKGAWQQALPSAGVDLQPDAPDGSASSSVKAPVYPLGQFVVAYKL